ncbi:small ribosomal subunit protein uS14m-like [Glandiceps talaboti]
MAAARALFSSVVGQVSSSCKVLKQVCCSNLWRIGTSTPSPIATAVPSRTYYADWRMLRDVKRRRLVKQYAVQRLRINSLRKNNILPRELQVFADKEIHALPRDSSTVRLRRRCAITSRPRGVVHKWRLSRIQFRILADANLMSGVTRAIW